MSRPQIDMSTAASFSNATLSSKDRERLLKASLPKPSTPQAKRSRVEYEACQALDDLTELELVDRSAPPCKRQRVLLTPVATPEAFRERSPLRCAPSRTDVMRDDTVPPVLEQAEEEDKNEDETSNNGLQSLSESIME
mmetsp:Transcript_11389/g.21326  ORF Transcript_11389/g.21326 Transcript_11389/m.21326 type:complete len:138 (-) Transcript_11389:59-472(-)